MGDATDSPLARLKDPLGYVMGAAYLLAGIMHFVAPKVYAQIMPPALPRPVDLVYLSGIAEIGLGLGMLFDRTRRYAAWGLIGLLVAVFPANVYMATSDVAIEGVPDWASDPSETARWARLPLQGVLVLWAWWYTQPTAESEA